MAHQKVGKLKNMIDGYPHQLKWKQIKLIFFKQVKTLFLKHILKICDSLKSCLIKEYD